MSERSFKAGDGTESSFERKMYRRSPSGEVELVDVDYDRYCHPPKGAMGLFELHGWSPFYKTESVYDGKPKVVTRMRAEYLIVKLPDAPDLVGRLFDQQFPVPRQIDDSRSKLGQFLRALLDRQFAPDEDIDADHFIGTQFVTSVTRDEDGDKVYCGISWQTINPKKTKLSPYVNAVPQLASVAAGGDAGDMAFEGDDEDL